METAAQPRPRTPVYATLTQRFAAALRDISRGADVAVRLKKAEDEVERVIERKKRRRGEEGPSTKGQVTRKVSGAQRSDEEVR